MVFSILAAVIIAFGFFSCRALVSAGRKEDRFIDIFFKRTMK